MAIENNELTFPTVIEFQLLYVPLVFGNYSAHNTGTFVIIISVTIPIWPSTW